MNPISPFARAFRTLWHLWLGAMAISLEARREEFLPSRVRVGDDARRRR